MAQGIVIKIEGSGEGAAEALRLIEAKMQEASSRGKESAEHLAEAWEKVEGIFAMAGIGLGLQEVIDKTRELISQSMELAVEIGHMSQQTGISVQNLSTLKFVSDQTGVSFEVLSKGFKKLSTNLLEVEQGSKEAQRTFSAIGISQKDLTATGGDLYKVMSLVADRFKEMPDGFVKNATATQLFGRAGQDLIPILNQGSAAIEKYREDARALGLELDENGVKKLEELHHSVAEARAAWSGLALTLTSSVAPALKETASTMTGLIELMRVSPSQTAKGIYGAVLQDLFGAAGPGLEIQLDAAQKLAELQKKAAQQGGGKDNPTGGAVEGFSDQPHDNWVTVRQTFIGARIQALLAQEQADRIEANKAAAEAQKVVDAAAERAMVLSALHTTQPEVTLDSAGYERGLVQQILQQRVQAEKDRQAQQDASKKQMNAEDLSMAAGMITGFMDQMSEMAIRGKMNFKNLVDSAISDLSRFAAKVLEQRALLPLLNSLFGMGNSSSSAPSYTPSDYAQVLPSDLGNILLNHDANGGDINGGWAVVGDGGDGSGSELFAPKGPGTVLPHDVLEGIAAGRSGGGGAPNVTINTINNSSAQVQQRNGGVSFDASARQFVIHTVLEDMNQGGPLSGAMSGFSRS